MTSPNTKPPLEDFKIHIKPKLSALWVAVTLCYLYGDYFGLFKPGVLQSMLDGRMGPLGPTTQGVLLGTAALMAVPSLMVVLCLTLPPVCNRLANIVFGMTFSAIMLVTMPGEWVYYQFLAVIEVGLTAAIVWNAWRWPRQQAGA